MSIEYVVIIAILGVILGAIAGSYGTQKACQEISNEWKRAFEEEGASHLADVKHYCAALRYIVSLQRFSHEELSRLMRIADGKEQYTPDEKCP
jgi:hypothetical protein